MKPIHALFVAEYLVDLNASAAAIRAGYSKNRANQEGYRLLQKPEIAAAIAAAHQARLAATNITGERVLQEFARVAFQRPKRFWKDGDLIPIEDLDDDDAACIAGFEVIIKNAKAGDGITDTIHKLKFWDKVRALETLARHCKIGTDTNVNLNLDKELITLLQSARPRADKANKL